VDDFGGSKPYQRVDSIVWNEAEQHGKVVKINGFPAQHKVKVFYQPSARIMPLQTNLEIVQDKMCGAFVGRPSNFTEKPRS
jgi:hypothetical protein